MLESLSTDSAPVQACLLQVVGVVLTSCLLSGHGGKEARARARAKEKEKKMVMIRGYWRAA